MNVIGYDPNDPNETILNNGDGSHFASYNEVADSGNGLHIASYNKVRDNGDGTHIAVYGKVDDNDDNAMAGVFKGDVTARNYVSTINIFAGVYVKNQDDDYSYDPKYTFAFYPVSYHRLGKVEIKLIIKVSNMTGDTTDHHFRLNATTGSEYASPIRDTDTWTWTYISGTNYLVESEWKTWDAGTTPWMLRFQIKNDDDTEIVFYNAYVMIRPSQDY